MSPDIFSVQLRPSSNIFRYGEEYYQQSYAKWTEIEIQNKEYSMYIIEEYIFRWPQKTKSKDY